MSRIAIEGLPDSVGYDEARRVVRVGTGEFGPVTSAVWTYAVGGRGVIGSWVNYRKLNPGGKKTSSLDTMHVAAWEPEWTSEFIDLLTVLTRLVDLEARQAALLDRVLTAPLLSRDDLAGQGVGWPQTSQDRAPATPERSPRNR